MADINTVMTKSMELDWRIESLLNLSPFYDYDDLSGLYYDIDYKVFNFLRPYLCTITT